MQSLNLSHNSLSGPLPNEWASSFPELEVLDVSFNFINSSLPAGRCSASTSTVVDVSGSRCNFCIWGTRYRLDIMKLAAQHLCCMPVTICSVLVMSAEMLSVAGWAASNSSFLQLQSLSLGYNALRGSIPEGWSCQWPQLRQLTLAHNALESLPACARSPFFCLLYMSIPVCDRVHAHAQASCSLCSELPDKVQYCTQ